MGTDIVDPLGESAEPLMKRYRHALGSFVHDFAILEVALFRLLCAVSAVSDEIGKALFSGMRADALVANLRRCYQARGCEIGNGIEAALSQTTAINGARNVVIHYVTLAIEDDETEVLAFNDLRYSAQNARQERFSPEILDQMSHDLRIISAILSFEKADIVEPGSIVIAEETRQRPHTWQYKPPARQNPRRKEPRSPNTRKARPKRAPQPEPFSE